MFTVIGDVFNMNALAHHLVDGNVRAQHHPNFPVLTILNYTESCTWNKAWDEVTLACRGLIYNRNTGEVVARPMRKFFNHNQEGAPTLSLDTPVIVTEKMDGSMGILYKTPDDRWAIATRGSFASAQALWATEYYNTHYADFKPEDDFTYIFEIIYPENRIVVDYGDKQGLVLLAAVHIPTGKSFTAFGIAWPGETVEILPYNTYGEVVASPERKNKEGFVLHGATNGDEWRVKIKHEEYMILHKFMTNTSPKNIWEVLAAGKDPAEVFAIAPDEFHEWMKGVIEKLKNEFDATRMDAVNSLSFVLSNLPDDHTRRDLATQVSKCKNPGLLFLLYDGKDTSETIWKMIRPRGDEKMVVKLVNPDAD